MSTPACRCQQAYQSHRGQARVPTAAMTAAGRARG